MTAGATQQTSARLGRGSSPRRLVMAVALAAALAGCAGTPEGMLRPVAAEGGARKVDMLTVTTRAPADDAGVLFTGDRGAEVSFTNIVVSIPPNREVGTMQWPRATPGDPSTDFVTTNVRPLRSTQVKDWLRTARGSQRRVFVYVHGFNTRFDRAVFRFAQLTHDADANAAPVLFSWPSRGRVLDYRRDLDNATYSRSDLADLLRMTAESGSVGEIVVLAHSMGAWVAVEALRNLALERGGIPGKITNVILASPDLDVGVFRRQMMDIGPRRPPFTIFVSQADRALRLSAFLAIGLTRLGAVDPSLEEYQAQLRSTERITILDLTALRSGDRINHSAYGDSPAVVRLIGDRLIQGEGITDDDVSPADAIGSAAGLVITAPIRVFQAAAGVASGR